MSTVQLAEMVAGAVERGRFLRRASVATLGALIGALGLAESAQALWNFHGCNLCAAPSNCPPGATCSWCWTGTCHSCSDRGGANYMHSCCEGYNDDIECYGGGCTDHRICSYYIGYFAC
jgi:hypothetical protein